jgi:beta-1,4-N-acetylglucosaminyltransferase
VIFVTVGTTDFDALVRAVDSLVPQLNEEVEVQIGRGHYEPRNCKWFRFAPSLEPYYERADVVIAHGGLGTIMEVLRRGGRLIGVANPDRYDQHQEDLLGYLAEEDHLIWCGNLDSLPQDLERARSTSFRQYVSPECRIDEVIGNFLEGTAE